MKKRLFFLSFLMGTLYGQAQQLNTPQPSPGQTVTQQFGLSQVELSYSRPAVKDRVIFGALVPYGKVWRTGANGATTITFGDDVMFGNVKVPAGKYGLLSIPNAGEWTIILTKQLDVTNPSLYKPEMDVARVTATPQDLPFSIESLMIMFGDVKGGSMTLSLAWDRTVVSVPITTDIDSKVMTQINDLMTKDNRPYFGAAMYYMNNGKDLNKALEWFNKAAEQDPKAYWVLHQKANCLAKLGKKPEAIAAATKSRELAVAGKNEDYVTLNDNLIKSLK